MASSDTHHRSDRAHWLYFDDAHPGIHPGVGAEPSKQGQLHSADWSEPGTAGNQPAVGSHGQERTEELESALAELSDAHESLKELNTVDALTGIKNRQYFDTIFEQEWRRATRQKYPLSLLLLDIDHFKRVNETFGHLAGDECLRIFARAAWDLLRRPADIVARYGSEEFVVLLPYVENDNAVMLAEQVRSAIADRTIKTTDEFITITCSVGVSTANPSEGDDRKDALAAADIALYEVKASGRNRVSNAGNLTVEPAVRENQTS